MIDKLPFDVFNRVIQFVNPHLCFKTPESKVERLAITLMCKAVRHMYLQTEQIVIFENSCPLFPFKHVKQVCCVAPSR